MKKIITAKEQWMNAMNNLREQGFECDALCDGLGAFGDNEFYSAYTDSRLFYFSKVGEEYKEINASDISEEYLLSTNWEKLDPNDDWYDLKAVWKFLVDNEKGKNAQSPIDLCDLIWMGIYTDGDGVSVRAFENKEVEVSTEEIEAIRKEIVERCKGHSIEEVRDMFDGYNWGEYGEGSFDFLYKDFIFSIQNTDNAKAEGDWFLSCIVCNEWSESDSFKTTTLPIPPKEIHLDMSDIVDEKPDLSFFKSCTNISFDYMVERMRESCINLITDIYQKIGEKFVEIDTTKWLEKAHCYFAEYNEGYAVALTRNDKGDVVLTGTDDGEWDEYMVNENWSFVSLEEMLYIINQLTSK